MQTVYPAAYADPKKRHAMEQLLTLLQGSLEARGKVLVKLNVSDACYEAVLKVLPAAKSPTVSKLASGDWAVESEEIRIVEEWVRDGIWHTFYGMRA